jgi:hypothetical protein
MSKQIEIATSTKKLDPTYRLTITTYGTSPLTPPTTIKISRPFSDWFDAAGHFHTVPFQQMLASQIPAIARVDPGKAEPTQNPADWVKYAALTETLDAAADVASVSGAAAAGKGSATRRKA